MMVHWKEILVEEIPCRGCSIGETESFLLPKDTNLDLLEASQTFEDIFSENGTDEWPSTHTESDWSDTEWPDDISDFGDEFGGERPDELVPTRLSEGDLGSNNSFNITNIRSSIQNNSSSSSSSNSNNSFNITNFSSSDNSISMNSIIIINNNNNSNNSMIGIKVVSQH
jgi:hypothetical protein